MLEELEIDGVDGILADLGVSSYQIDTAERGFSFMRDARLDMRMNKTQELDAYTVVNTYSEEELAKIMFMYGEEKNSRQIARKIVKGMKKFQGKNVIHSSCRVRGQKSELSHRHSEL